MKPRARENLERLPIVLSRVAEIKASAILLSPGAYHYRFTGPRGAQVDYWATTARWMPKSDHTRISSGLEAMIRELLDDGLDDAQPDLVTIFTDASHCNETKLGGWAAWCKNGGGPGELISGGLRARAETTDLSEAMAIANALYVARNKGILRRGGTVLIQCDCAPALARIYAYVPGTRASAAPGTMPIGKGTFGKARKWKKKANAVRVQQWDDVLRQVNSLVASENIRLLVRHVKGHSGKMDSRSQINALCDRAAKEEMRKLRDEYRKWAV